MNSSRLHEIFEEAKNDHGTTNVSGNGYKARMKLGVKISRDMETEEIVIYNDTRGSNYYVEMGNKDQALIMKEGWVRGVHMLTLQKYKDKLERIKHSISKEVNGGNSKKKLNYFKEARQQILNKYFKITQKLND